MPSKPTTAAPEPEQTFEIAMDRLEAIVEEMESDEMPLEALLERYEEGTRLVQTCQEKLAAAEKRIEIITRKAGKPELSAFDPAVPTAAPAPAQKPPPPESDEDDSVSLF